MTGIQPKRDENAAFNAKSCVLRLSIQPQIQTLKTKRNILKLHEQWRHEYNQDRYLSHLSDIVLSGRLRYFVENLTTLELNGKIGLKDIRNNPAQTLMRKFTHAYQELVLRKRQPELQFLKGSSIPKAMIGHEARLKELNRYAHDKKPDLIKFGKKEYFEKLSFKVSLASSFSDPLLNAARIDDEMKAIYYPNPSDISVTTRGGAKLEGIKEVKVMFEAPADYYIMCTSSSFDVRLFGDFDADSCLFVYDSQRFSKDLLDQISKQVPVISHASAQVTYVDPIRPNLGAPQSVEFHKHIKYLYQNEFRHVFISDTGNNPKDLFFNLPGSSVYTEIVCL